MMTAAAVPLTSAAPKPVAVSLVRPVQPEASMLVSAAPEVKVAVSIFLTLALAGTEIAATSEIVNMSPVPSPPSNTSRADKAPDVVDVNVSLPLAPVKAAPESIPVVSVLDWSSYILFEIKGLRRCCARK